MRKLALVGISKGGKIFEKLFIINKDILDIQLSEDFMSITFNKINCVQTKNFTKLNGEMVNTSCITLIKRHINCIEDILRNFYICENKDLIDNIKLLDERIKYVIYLTQDDIILPFSGEQDIDVLSFNILTEYKKRIESLILSKKDI
jgi:hypothetical protein